MSEPERLRQYCFGCGPLNPMGLGLQFRVEGGRVSATFTAKPEHQGFPGQVHGGIIASVLDEAMGWAMYASGTWAVTGKIDVRYREPLALGGTALVEAHVARRRSGAMEIRGELRTPRGLLLAESTAIFMPVPPDRAEELRRLYLGE